MTASKCCAVAGDLDVLAGRPLSMERWIDSGVTMLGPL